MNFPSVNAYTNPSSYNRAEQSGKNTSVNNRSSQFRGDRQNTGGCQPQNSDLFSSLLKLIQQLLQQFQPKQDDPQEIDPLTLSQQQQDNINAGIGFVNADTVSILDQDCSATVSEGDLFKATYIPESAQVTDFERTLSANDAALINGDFGSLLPLNEGEKQQLWDALNTPAERFNKVFDRDGSGTLSTGDIALGSFNGAFGGTPPPQFPTSYVTLAITSDGQISRKDEG